MDIGEKLSTYRVQYWLLYVPFPASSSFVKKQILWPDRPTHLGECSHTPDARVFERQRKSMHAFSKFGRRNSRLALRKKWISVCLFSKLRRSLVEFCSPRRSDAPHLVFHVQIAGIKDKGWPVHPIVRVCILHIDNCTLLQTNKFTLELFDQGCEYAYILCRSMGTNCKYGTAILAGSDD